MQTTAIPQSASFLGPGPIALALSREPAEDEKLYLLAGSLIRADVVRFAARRLTKFLQLHQGTYFICKDVAAFFWRLHDHLEDRKEELALAALWALVRESRLVDVPLLDRQIRHAHGKEGTRLRPLDEVTGHKSRRYAGGALADGLEPEAGEIRSLLQAFAQIGIEIEQLQEQAEPVPLPPYVFPELSPEEIMQEEARLKVWWGEILDHQSHAESGKQQAVVPDVNPGSARLLRSEANEAGPIGHGVEIFAAVALERDRHPGLIVDEKRLPELLLRVEREYRAASGVLARDKPGEATARKDRKVMASECFRWNGEEIRRNRRGYPETHENKLAKWLRQMDRGLCDVQNQRATIPRKGDGEPSHNPEQWGIWTGCDRYLWAWRQVFRMAEMGRIADAGGCVRPRYETLPALRSLEPNLTVYRSLRLPIFRPREGHVFVAGELRDLTARCLTAVCLKRSYTPGGRARLYHHILGQENPLAVAAADLYIQNAILQTRTTEIIPEAQSRFSEWANTDSDKYYYWLRLTNALLATAPLGLPSSLLTKLLQLDYSLTHLTEPHVLCLQTALVEGVAYELQGFMADLTFDLVTSRLGLTANEGLSSILDIEHPEHSGTAVRNALSRRRQRSPVSKIRKERLAEERQAVSAPPSGRKELFTSMGASLGGRVTLTAASAAVRREEVQFSVDDVMLWVAHDLAAAGYRVLGLAGNEFVMQVPAAQASEETLRGIGSLAHKASRRLLKDVAAPVGIEFTQLW